jgi:hypothetical protein
MVRWERPSRKDGGKRNALGVRRCWFAVRPAQPSCERQPSSRQPAIRFISPDHTLTSSFPRFFPSNRLFNAFGNASNPSTYVS